VFDGELHRPKSDSFVWMYNRRIGQLPPRKLLAVRYTEIHVGEARGRRKLTSNVHSWHDLNRPEAKRFRVKLANLNIPKVDLVEGFVDLLEAENLKSKTSLMNTLPLCQLMWPLWKLRNHRVPRPM
jgi:hypothetical protein